MKARRAYFLFWLIAGIPALFMFFLLIPLCALNLWIPERRRWKTILLAVGYGVFVPAAIVNLVSYGNLYYVAFTALYFLLMAVPRTRRPTFFVTLYGVVWLYLAAVAQAYGGWIGLPVVTVLLGGFAVLAWKRGWTTEWFHFPADAFTHYFTITLVLLTWFFFLPSSLPLRAVTSQTGVQAVATFAGTDGYRERFLFHQMNFVDEVSPRMLLVGAKRKLPAGVTVHRNEVYDVTADRWRPSPLPAPVTSVHLIRCGSDDAFVPPAEARNWAERSVNMGRGFSWYGPTMAGYCLPRAGVYLVGDETSAMLVDRATGRRVHEFAFSKVIPLAPLRFFAPYGDGMIASFHDIVLTRIAYDAATQQVTTEATVYEERLFGESMVLGEEGHPYIYLVETYGRVRKIDPGGPRVVAENKVLPGFRFATFDADRGLLLIVNELAGVMEIVDTETMRPIDRVFVGKAARRFNPSPSRPGVGYMATSFGILQVDLCARLPDHCIR